MYSPWGRQNKECSTFYTCYVLPGNLVIAIDSLYSWFSSLYLYPPPFLVFGSTHRIYLYYIYVNRTWACTWCGATQLQRRISVWNKRCNLRNQTSNPTTVALCCHIDRCKHCPKPTISTHTRVTISITR